MPKRFTATEKWDDAWFCHLPPIHKLIWIYLCDSCDAAGIWEVNKRLAEFKIAGETDAAFAATINWDKFIELAGARVQPLHNGTHWRLIKFIPFQYPSGLSSFNKAHTPAFISLARHGISADSKTLGYSGKTPISSIGDCTDKVLARSLEGSQDTDTDTDTEKDKETAPPQNEEVKRFYETAYSAFPKANSMQPNGVNHKLWDNCARLVRQGRKIETFIELASWRLSSRQLKTPNDAVALAD